MTSVNCIIRDYTLAEVEGHLDWMKHQMSIGDAVEMVWTFGRVTVSVNRSANNRLLFSVHLPGDTPFPLKLSAIPSFVVANQ